jgi:murein DD-endopeptidase MepM/ murein hydrolase activator NlpD
MFLDRSSTLWIARLLFLLSFGLPPVAASQDYTIPGINAWNLAKANGFTFQPLPDAPGQWVTTPNDGVNTLLQVKQGTAPFQTTITLGQVVGGNASTTRPGSGTRTVKFEFFGGRKLAPGWTVVRVEATGNYTWERTVTTGGTDLSFRVKTSSTSSTTGTAIIKQIVLRGPDGANPAHAFYPMKSEHLKLAAPFTFPHTFSPPIGVDHNNGAGPNDWDCSSYRKLAFPTCYKGHTGSDFLLAGGFLAMDLGSLDVLAAAPGVVRTVGDGEFDRCFADLLKQTISCQGNLGRIQRANFVEIVQDDGLFARYYHLKKDSVTVRKDQRVACGQPLGKVGSSGVSAAPHLHFELRKGSVVIDPYKEGLWFSINPLTVPDGKCPF